MSVTGQPAKAGFAFCRCGFTRRTFALLGTVFLAASAHALPVTFRYAPPAPVDRVNVAGTFNGWKSDATPMTKGADGAYSAHLDLPAGPYMYKFVVNGSQWMADPGAGAPVPPDGNSVKWAVPAGQSTEHKRGDGKILAFAVKHDPKVDVQRVDKGHVKLSLQTAANDVDAVELYVGTTGANSSQNAPLNAPVYAPLPTYNMVRTSSNGLFDTFSSTVPLVGKGEYSFTLHDGGKRWDVVRDEVIGPDIGVPDAPWFNVDTAKLPFLETPEWVQNTVWYQVFPERFWDGDKSNDRRPPVGVPDWNTPLSAFPNPNDHYWGGDLQGVIDRIPYLKSMGITGIYLNPIFKGPDTHKYATTDYMLVDPDFGSEATLKQLCDTAHRNGMKVMLDGVFNHTSVYNPFFRDILKNQQASRYAGWYVIHSFPVLDPVTNYQGANEAHIPYEGWWGIKWMPKLNTLNPPTTQYLLNVATHWIDAGADAWRLDAANEVSSEYWRKFRKVVKARKPDALIIGEIWDNASQWLQGDQFDAVMNYRFRGAALDFFAHGTTDGAKFAGDVNTLLTDYSPQATAAMFNMLSSHDTERLLNESHGDARRAALATVFQMAYPGAPSVYYGDENGMAGGRDPDNRRPMVWDPAQWNQTLRGTFQRAIALRNAHPALRGLGFQALYAPSGVKAAAFLRTGGGETAITVFNASENEQTITVPLKDAGRTALWTDVWRAGTARTTGGNLTVTLPALSASVFVPATASNNK